MFAALIMIAATGSLVVLIRKYKQFDKTESLEPVEHAYEATDD